MPVAARSQPTPKAWPRMSGRQRPTLYPLTVAAEEPWTRRLGPGLFSFGSGNAGLAKHSLCAGSDDPWAVTHVTGKRLPVGLGWPGGRARHTIKVDGRKACISLEPAFWGGLREIAEGRGV